MMYEGPLAKIHFIGWIFWFIVSIAMTIKMEDWRFTWSTGQVQHFAMIMFFWPIVMPVVIFSMVEGYLEYRKNYREP